MFSLQSKGKFKGSLELGPEPGEKAKGSYGSLKLKVKFVSSAQLFAAFEVPHVSFPARKGCRVTLFQDAHIGQCADLLPEVKVQPSIFSKEIVQIEEDDDDDDESKKKKKRDKKAKKKKKKHKLHLHLHRHHHDDDEEEHAEELNAPEEETSTIPTDDAPKEEWTYTRKNCWEKVYKAILQAKHFIYITGWSVDTSISLIRERPIYRNGKSPEDENDTGMLTIGELLKKKALEGVRVCLLLWNEATSVSGVGKEGLMFTHDEFTKTFFKGSGVFVNLAYRDGAMTSGNKFMWTHHQKSIILDAEALHPETTSPEQVEKYLNDTKRRIIAFVGGLDLCDGRWDTPQHSLYRTLQTHHKNDFHQVWQGITIEHGPREPWHDIHSRVEGPIARDVMRNFEQRWKKQAAPHADRLVDISKLPIIPIEEENVCDARYWNSWTVQLFRSIDHYSAIMENHEKVDKSIQLAYLHHIRRAKRFIFIENQYFLGSAQAWENDQGNDIQCNNLIPLELTMKIVSQIKKGKPFTVYVIIPMYPEGVPADGAVQEILCWQNKTMEMMYSRIYRALEEENLLDQYKPEDYLLFFCMGQRETEDHSQAVGGDFDEEERPNQVLLNKTRRFVIYVHSKMMIVDDDYIIVGSANINERSMAGDRDSEIAVGAYQPQFTYDNCSGQPRGQIHAFRMGLWSSHMRRSLPCFEFPESVECAREINKIATENWELFNGDEVVEMEPHGHLLKYPVSITETGKVVSLPDSPYITDTEALVVGADSLMLPNLLTL